MPSSALHPPLSLSGPTFTKRSAMVLALWWGLLSAFSAAMSDDQAVVIQGVALTGVVLGSLFIARSSSLLLVWTHSTVGLLIGAHVLAAVASGLLNGASVSAILRYVALLPAISVIVLVVRSGERGIAGLHEGLTLAGVIFV